MNTCARLSSRSTRWSGSVMRSRAADARSTVASAASCCYIASSASITPVSVSSSSCSAPNVWKRSAAAGS
jgi:hypothetical protein